MKTQLAGTGRLVRVIMRLDRVRLSVWVSVVPLLALITSSSFDTLYPTLADRRAFAATVEGKAAIIVFTGRPAAVDTIGGFTAWRVSLNAGVLVALMSLFLVARHTRAEEEAGRAELVRAAAVGRHAGTVAALVVVGAAQVVLGALTAAAVLTQGVPVAGAVAFGAAVTALGWWFAGATAVAAQLTPGSRPALGIVGGVLAVAFAARAIGDTTDASWLSWCSPLGWMQAVQPFAGERWWVLLLPLVSVGALLALALRLEARRDLGSGLVEPHAGPPVAHARLRTPLALAIRLQRTWFVGWAIGMTAAGLAFGSVAEGASELVEGNAALADFLEQVGGRATLSDAYLSATFSLTSVLAGGYAIAAALRLRTEETSLRAEPLLATAVSRGRWVASHLTVVVAGTVVLLALAGFGAGVGHGIRTSDAGELGRLTIAALVHVPASLLLAAMAVALFGVAPRFTPWAWGALVASMLVTQIGPALDLPQWFLDLSPLTHTPALPSVDMRWLPVAVLAALAAVLGAIGATRFRTRDLMP